MPQINRPLPQMYRHVVSLSDIPIELHEWFKNEAERLSRERGKKVSLSKVIVKALEEYREKEMSRAS